MGTWVSPMPTNLRMWYFNNTTGWHQCTAYMNEPNKEDFTEGMKLLKPGSWDVPKYHFTPQAAHAFCGPLIICSKAIGIK